MVFHKDEKEVKFMKTKEVEKLTGLSKQTLIWYEKEGLIRPKRNENHYREYTEEDVQLLRLIKTLRSMNVSQWNRYWKNRKHICSRRAGR